jgi:hypothetical protein
LPWTIISDSEAFLTPKHTFFCCHLYQTWQDVCAWPGFCPTFDDSPEVLPRASHHHYDVEREQCELCVAKTGAHKMQVVVGRQLDLGPHQIHGDTGGVGDDGDGICDVQLEQGSDELLAQVKGWDPPQFRSPFD